MSRTTGCIAPSPVACSWLAQVTTPLPSPCHRGSILLAFSKRYHLIVNTHHVLSNGHRDTACSCLHVFVIHHTGLLSTKRDMTLFSQMLLNGGALNGRRILSPLTVSAMTSNMLPGDCEVRHSLL